MVIIYVLASLLGALATFVMLSSYSWLIAPVCAPLVASAVAMIVAVGVCMRTDEEESSRLAAMGKTHFLEHAALHWVGEGDVAGQAIEFLR